MLPTAWNCLDNLTTRYLSHWEIALSAKMAKADGRVTRDEVEAFKDAFKVSPGEMKEAARAFNLAKYVCTTGCTVCGK
jgi:hypothetical protein